MTCKHLIRRRIINKEDLISLPTPVLFHIGKDDQKDNTNELKDYVENAVFIGFNSLVGPKGEQGGNYPLPDMNEFAKKMMRIGLNPGSLVVIYSPMGLPFAARFWWMLKTIGITGYVMYSAEELKNYEYTRPKIMNYETLVFDSSQTADYEEVRKHLKDPNYYMIDSRDEDSYHALTSLGHIPGAHHHYYNELLPDGVPDYPDINPLFPIEEEHNIILYSNAGITACVNALLLESISIPYRIYVGGFSDWITHQDMTVEK